MFWIFSREILTTLLDLTKLKSFEHGYIGIYYNKLQTICEDRFITFETHSWNTRNLCFRKPKLDNMLIVGLYAQNLASVMEWEYVKLFNRPDFHKLGPTCNFYVLRA